MLSALVALCGWVVVARSAGVGIYRADGGDIATWIFVHEWLSRGLTLYRDVWEHKDLGFLMFVQPFYRVGSTFGLYMSGVLTALVLAVGIYIGVRRRASHALSLCLASSGLTIYVLSPTFLSVYKESYAVSFGVLAVSVVASRPLFGGALIGVSTAIKVSGVGILICVAVVLLVECISRGHEVRIIMLRLGRLFVGFGAVMGLTCMWAYHRGILGSWVEVVRYNVEYSSFRRETFREVADLRGLLALLSPGYDTFFYLLWLAIAVGVLTYIKVNSRLMLGTYTTMAARTANLDFNLLQGVALLVATSVAIVSQTPPRFQHYTYFVGALVYVGAVLTANILATEVPLLMGRTVSLFMVMMLLLGIGLIQAVRADGLAWPITNLKRWSELDTIESPLPELRMLPGDSRVVFVNLGGSRINFEDLDEDVQLGCRFFFHYPNLTPRYGAQMLDCLGDNIDLVVLGTKAEMSESFSAQLEMTLRRQYVSCRSSQTLFSLWASSERLCQIVNVSDND